MIGFLVPTALSLLLHYKLCGSALLAAGKIEQCINDGSELDCDQKVVVSLTLTNDQGEVESLQTTLETVEDVDGVERTLTEPWSITLAKSSVFISYPLQYVHAFHAKPTELVIEQTPNIFGFGGCVDDPNSNPTCGWARDHEGNNIADSQGFCCSCTMVGQETVRGLDGTCSLLGSDVETAHCLSFEEEDRWYSAYEMLPPETIFTVSINIFRGSGREQSQELIVLSPANTQRASEDGVLVARLLGDLVSYSSHMSMDNYYFFVPSSPINDPRVQNWLDYSMIIEKNAVTLDGRECDKIGVSFNAFRGQSNRCEKQQGECLNNQLEDYHQDGGYFAKNVAGDIDIIEVGHNDLRYFSYLSDIQQQSLVALTISTDEISFVINRADGHIEDCHIDNFESFATSGQLSCSVQNDGLVEAMFRVAVLNCTNGILSVTDDEETIEAESMKIFEFELHSSNQADSVHSCNVKLFDSLAVEIDSKRIDFTSTETVEDRGAQAGEGENSGSTGTGTAVEYSCESYCDSWLDMPCLVMKGCWGAIAKTVGIIFALLVGLCSSPCWFKHLVKFLKGLGRSSGESDSEESVASPSRSRSRRKHKKKKHRKRKQSRKREIVSSQHDVTLEMTDSDASSEFTESSESEHYDSSSSSKRRRKRRLSANRASPELETEGRKQSKKNRKERGDDAKRRKKKRSKKRCDRV